MDRRKYEVVVMGATGFTGKLVAEYLLSQYGINETLCWAMAGRNEEKLTMIANELGEPNIPCLVADNHDEVSLDQLTKSAKVICTTVGPYAKYGSLLVKKCVENGTHYCDLAGEVQWMRKMIDQHHMQASQNKVRIVHTCGFDSIPSDMGVFFLQQHCLEKLGKYCHHIKFRLKSAKGGFSGGTIASLSNVMDEAYQDRSLFKVLMDPYGLNPQDEREGPDEPDLKSIMIDSTIQAWIGPFIMATINAKVVRRSNALMDYHYGKEFRYDEATIVGKGFGGWLKGQIMRIGLGFLMAKPGSLIHTVVQKFLPDPGEGPGKSERENGFFNVKLIGIGPDGEIFRAKVTGDKDPGYGSTSKMLGESAVCLAKDILPESYGVLTPSVAMDAALLTRLQKNAGLTFTMQDKLPKDGK